VAWRGYWLAALLTVAAPAAPVPAAGAPLPRMPVPGDHDRLLVIAPHPDDESLCCAGLLQEAIAHGAAVGIVWITAGDGFELDALLVAHTMSPGSGTMQRLGKQRLREAHAAADELGVPRASQYVLGYPDRGVQEILGPYHDRTYRSRYTASTSVRYADAVSPDAPYNGADLERDFEHVIVDFRPTLVLAPAPQDLHPDHRASGELARRVLGRRGELGELRYWIIHARGWPRPLGLQQDLPLAPPDAAAQLDWESLPLSPEERARKLAALGEHRSQMEVMAPLMRAFVRSNEIFATPGR
jgi:LmbE family N-acetylglucosaminyl deacetylase